MVAAPRASRSRAASSNARSPSSRRAIRTDSSGASRRRYVRPTGCRANASIVSVSVDEQGDSVVAAFARELGLSFDILHDRSGAIQRTYQTTGVPESWVIDRDGVIVKKVIGPSEWDGPVNEALIRRLIEQHPDGD